MRERTQCLDELDLAELGHVTDAVFLAQLLQLRHLLMQRHTSRPSVPTSTHEIKAALMTQRLIDGPLWRSAQSCLFFLPSKPNFTYSGPLFRLA
jgi:hypothetical protein